MIKKLLTLTLIFILAALVPGRPAQAEPAPFVMALPVVMKQLGLSVAHLGPDLSRTMGVIQDPFNANMLYAYTFGSGVFKSIDYGQTWFASSTGMNYLVLHSMAADPLNAGVLYAGTYAETGGAYFGVYKSTNYGATWAPTGVLSNTWNGAVYTNPVVYAIEIDPTNPQRIYAGTRMRNLPDGALGGGGVFRSENGGAA